MNNAVIAGYVRSPFHFAHKGALVEKRPDDLAAEVVQGLIDQTGVDPAEIEDLIIGCAFPEGEQGFNLGRIVALIAELPISVAGATVNRFCGSSMQAIHTAAGAIRMDAGEAFICAGVESMSRVPMGGFNPAPNPDLYEKNEGAYMSMGETAENLARKYQITREEQEVAGGREPRPRGRRLGRRQVRRRGDRGRDRRWHGRARRLHPRPAPMPRSWPGSSPPSMPRARSLPAPRPRSATAPPPCSSAPRTTPRATGSRCSLASRPSRWPAACRRFMGYGPVVSSEKALARAGLKMSDIDVIELNEAFAVQALACARELSIDLESMNIDGGAIAIGHPLGATGARITGKAAQILRREDKRYALATQCIGGGQGISTVLEAA